MGFFFDRWGVIEATHKDRSRDPQGDAIESGAQEVEDLAEDVPEEEIGARFLTDPKDIASVGAWLKNAGWKIAASELRYVAKNPIELGETERQQAIDFLHSLDDHDDVHHVFAALK
jgi:transcriptional/translational regulatory protein YebC/TACO1